MTYRAAWMGGLVALVACGGAEPGNAPTGDAAPADAGLDASTSATGDAAVSGADASTEAGGDAASGPGWWRPGTSSLPWQWEIAHEIQTTSAADMGTGGTTYSGAPAAAPVVYDIDGFGNSAADVAALHALGKKVICYVEVGGAESYRPDYSKFPAAALGKGVPSYPSEKYLDIRDATVLAVMKERIDMCAAKSFDAVEPDLDDTYGFDTGFPLSIGDEISYLTKLSDYAHSKGMAWGLKNGGDGGDPAAFISGMLPHVEFAVVEEPYFLKTIDHFEPAFSAASKALFVAEYTNDTSSASTFCPAAIAKHTNAALFNVALDASARTPCE